MQRLSPNVAPKAPPPRPLGFRGLGAVVTCAILGLNGAPARAQGEAPGAAAKRFWELASKGDAKALDLLSGAERKIQGPKFAQLARMRWGTPMGAIAASVGDVLGEFVAGDWALVVAKRRVEADARTAAEQRGKFEANIAEYFPDAQRGAAKKQIRWSGNALETVTALYLKSEGGAWKVYPDAPSGFPLALFRAQMMKKWGANLLRWAGEDQGDSGSRPDQPYSGERPGASTAPTAPDAEEPAEEEE